MSEGISALFTRLCLLAALTAAATPAGAQDVPDPELKLSLPGLSGYAPATGDQSLATTASGEVTLEAKLTEDAPELTRGLVFPAACASRRRNCGFRSTRRPRTPMATGR
jgi:hypothetical protein